MKYYWRKYGSNLLTFLSQTQANLYYIIYLKEIQWKNCVITFGGTHKAKKMLIFEIPWSKACDKNPYFTFLRIFNLLWRHVCWAIIIHANFSEAKKVFCKKSPVSFREKTKTTRLLSSPLSLQLSSNKHLQFTTAQCPKRWKMSNITESWLSSMYLPLSWLITPRGLKSFSLLRLGVGYFGEKVSNCYCLAQRYCTFFGILQPL